MNFPFFNLVGACLLLVQSTFLFLKFKGIGSFDDAHWSAILLPLFISISLLIALLGGKAMSENHNRTTEYTDETEQISVTILEILSVVFLLLAFILLAVYLHNASSMPFFWITTSFFCSSTVWFIVGIIRFKRHDEQVNRQAFEDPMKQRNMSFAVAILFFIQGLFLILMNGPLGKLFPVSLWIIALPTIVFVLLSVYRTIEQTEYKHNVSCFDLSRQGSFVLLLFLVLYGIAGTIIHLDYSNLLDPEWIALPFMVYSAVAVLMFFCFTCVYSDGASNWNSNTHDVELLETDISNTYKREHVSDAEANVWYSNHFGDRSEMFYEESEPRIKGGIYV